MDFGYGRSSDRYGDEYGEYGDGATEQQEEEVSVFWMDFLFN